ncbi:MAG TPA: hypothetical protein VF363_12025 [Candidatus Eisenbacteria bacterium]
MHRGSGARIGRLPLLALILAAGVATTARAQDEFLLNDDRLARNQWGPRVARGASGTLVAAWQDGRNGAASTDYDIYAMTLRDPLALGSTVNRRLNDDVAGPDQSAPDIAASPSGTYLCVWEDARSGNRDVYSTALDSLGIPFSPNLRVNDDAASSDHLQPRVAAVLSDRYLVVWGDGREGQGEIYGSYRTASGGPIGANFRISVDPVPGGSWQGSPAVAVDASGRTLVVWLDGRAGGTVYGAAFDVFGQWLDDSGTPIGGNFKINDTTITGHCSSPAVAADPALGFLVGWIDLRNAATDPGDVYAQRYDPSGQAVGANVRVNDDAPGRDQRNVRAAAGPGAGLLIWEDLRGNLGIDSNVDAAVVPYDAGAPGANFRVNIDLPGRQGTPHAVWDGRDAFLGVWEDGRSGTSDAYGISFFPDGAHRGSDTQLNDDAAAFDQRRPELGHGPGQYIATWIDLRNPAGDLYGQWIAATGAREGVNHDLWVNDFVNRPVAFSSSVAPNGIGMVVAQIARFSDAGDIRGFRYGVVGEPPTSSFWVSDTLPSAQSTPVVVGATSGFAVLWIDSRGGTPRLYGQTLGLDGSRVGTNHPILAADPADPIYAIDLDVDPAGGFWICYAEGASGDQRLWLTHASGALVEDGTPLAVAPELPGGRAHPVIGVGPDGRIELVWLGSSPDGTGRLYYRSYSAALSPLAIDVALGESDATVGPQDAPTAAVTGTGSVIVWEERRQGNWSLWMQRFAGGVPDASGAVRVDEDLTGADQLDPSAGVDASGRILVIWSDARSTSSGTDILGRVFEGAPTAADDPPPAPEPPPPVPPRALRVGPARPNPFSSVTAAPVEVPVGGERRVRATIWNVHGARVASLYDAPAPGGRITLRWDGRGADGRPVASGVYWLRIESGGESRATRIVHLR